MLNQMSETSFALSSPESEASERLMSMVFGFMVSQAIAVVARLGIADLLEDGPRDIDYLAVASGSHAHSLYRVMRALASRGIFSETEDRTFDLTPMGRLLGKNALQGIGGFSTFFCSDWHWPVWGHLDYSVRTGKPAFEEIYHKPFFDYLEEVPRAAKIFNDGMTSFSAATGAPVVEGYNYAGITKLIDVGGGHGYLLASIVKHYPEITGVLFDTHSVINGAQPVLDALGVGDRIELVDGSFFDTISAMGDAIIMKHIIHDWNDENCLKILQNCHAALVPNGKLLVVEMIVPRANQPSIGKWLDLQMLMFLHSYERTEDEYSELFARAGFRLTGVFPTQSPFSVIEAVRI